MDADRWQRLWDEQQNGFMPDREERFRVLLDVVEVVSPGAPRVLDLAGGTGSITRRLLARRPDAHSVVLDVDRSLLAIASATFDGDDRVTVVHADLASADWLAALPVAESGYDAVVTTTALHWLRGERVQELYREVRGLLAEGGAVVNVEGLVDDGLPGLSRRLADWRGRARAAAGDPDPADAWLAWWEAVRADPELAPLAAERDTRFGSHHPRGEALSADWHVAALRGAGFAEVGLVWRGWLDAAVVGVR